MDPAEDVVLVLMDEVVRDVGGFMRLRGLAVEGEDEGPNALVRSTLALCELLKGVTEPLLFRLTKGRET